MSYVRAYWHGPVSTDRTQGNRKTEQSGHHPLQSGPIYDMVLRNIGMIFYSVGKCHIFKLERKRDQVYIFRCSSLVVEQRMASIGSKWRWGDQKGDIPVNENNEALGKGGSGRMRRHSVVQAQPYTSHSYKLDPPLSRAEVSVQSLYLGVLQSELGLGSGCCGLILKVFVSLPPSLCQAWNMPSHGFASVLQTCWHPLIWSWHTAKLLLGNRRFNSLQLWELNYVQQNAYVEGRQQKCLHLDSNVQEIRSIRWMFLFEFKLKLPLCVPWLFEQLGQP